MYPPPLKISTLLKICIFTLFVHKTCCMNIENVVTVFERARVNVSWESVGNDVKYTLKVFKVDGLFTNTPNTLEEKTTQNDYIVVNNLEYQSEYEYTLSAVDYSSGIMLKNETTKKSSTLNAPQAISSDNGYEADIFLTYNDAASIYQIIVRKLLDAENTTTLNLNLHPSSIDQTILKDYDDNMIIIQYITLNISGSEVNGDKQLTVGDGTTKNGVLNAKLQSMTRYTFFQRTFMNDSTVVSHEWMNTVTTKANLVQVADDSLTTTEITLITVGIAIGIIMIIFLLVVCCHWRYSRNYAPKPKKKQQNTVQRQLMDPGIPVTESDFYDHVAQMKFHNFKGFYEEFSKMEVEHKATEEFRKPDNISKNRYMNVPCYDHSRVIMDLETDKCCPYIHANFVPGFDSDRDYILTQSPLPETTNDFWAMVWKYDVTTVVMIGQTVEKGNNVCAPYFPENNDHPITTICGKVRLDNTHHTTDYVIRGMTLTSPDGITNRKIIHLQFLSWPAVRITPACPTVFLQFMKSVNTAMGRVKDKPIIIHGTTGSGRSGIYACIDSQIRRVKKQGDINVYTAVQEIRESRCDGVKTLDEYIFIHDTVLEYLLKRNIQDIEVEYLPHYIDNISKKSPGELFSMEYNFLAATVVSATQKMDVANQQCNKHKNRYNNIRPFDNNRVKLSKLLNSEGSDYINASYIDTYSGKKTFIATQAPLVGTVADFWRMVFENESWVIVMLGQEIEKGQLKADRFWPEEGYVMALGHLTVKYISKQTDNLKDVVIRQIELVHNKKGDRKLIQLYQYLSWPSHEGITSESINSLVQLVHQSQLWKDKLKAKTITLVSSSGIGRPGVFVALRSLQEESELEGHVNIFQTVSKLRQQRAAFIQTREEYILIYTSTMEITKHVRRKSIVTESLADISTLGLDILPCSVTGSVSSIMERLNSVSHTSEF